MLTTLPTIPTDAIIEYQQLIPYSVLKSSGITFKVLVVGIPSNYVVCGICTRLITQFAGPSLTSITCSIGGFAPDSILTDILYYGLELELTQIVTPNSFTLSGPPNNNLALVSSNTFAPITALYFNGAHDVAAYFSLQGGTLENLTAGVVQVIVQIRPF